MITVLGSTGFIGSHLKEKLDYLRVTYQTPKRDESFEDRELGIIIYCIGLTADFRQRPLDTVEAHVCKLLEIVRNCKFQKIIYLSSTRLYGSVLDVDVEAFRVSPTSLSDVYNISKLMGESIIHTLGDAGCVVRLSNVYGHDIKSDNFLSTIIRDAVKNGVVELDTSLDSEKDYIHVDDVSRVLVDIALSGKKNIYNLASGINTSNEKILNKISQVTGCKVIIKPDAKKIAFPLIAIDGIQSEFKYVPSNLLEDIQNLLIYYKNNLEIKNDSH